jgi:hypothetical protein
MSYEIVSGANYSAYVEFGTIDHVSVPAGIEDYAMQFKGKGIIKHGGVHPRPFFFPQLPIAQEAVKKNVQPLVAEALRK